MIDITQLIARNRTGGGIGLPCFCTANAYVLSTVLSHAAQTGRPTVIEATCNQVNQDGGYTGMTPQAFVDWTRSLARETRVAQDQLVLGGDHLGPNPWRDQPPEVAMAKARVLVRDYVRADFTKIHLDASMALGGESQPSFSQIAERAADLCAVAEANAPDPAKLVYIIGTEVPIPGGETEDMDALDVTTVDRFEDTISTHKAAFEAQGLTSAWDRVVSVVTQPGVDFSHTTIYPFQPDKAAALAFAIRSHRGLTYEAHSTDYQSTSALKALVDKHFFFLKVGPELTFRFREAIYALAAIEEHLLPRDPSNIRQVIANEMASNDKPWRSYYGGSETEIETLKVFSYSDRIRYYWPAKPVEAALAKLITNLRQVGIPEMLASQYFTGLNFGDIPTDPEILIQRHIETSIDRYFQAAGQ